MITTDDFNIWTLYDHPTDFPDCFVARRFSGMTGKASDQIITGESPGQVLEKIQAIDPNACQWMPRADGDDPVIIGCWL